MNNLGIGIIGCGNISTTYFTLRAAVPRPRGARLRRREPGGGRGPRGGVRRARRRRVDELLANPEVDLVINLTIPDAHGPVTRAALEAGKHVYSEKPLVLSVEEGLAIKALADAKGLRVGCAPDTFLGGSHQQARAMIDEGAIGTVTAGTAHVMSPRHGALAPEPGLLLPARRRADARPRAVLHRQPDQPDRPGAPGGGARHLGDADPHDLDRRPAQGPERAGQDPDQHPRAARLRQRRHDHPLDQLGRLGAPPRPHGALRHRGHAVPARPELLRRRSGDGGTRRRDQAGRALGPSARRAEPGAQGRSAGQLPLDRPRRHGRRRSARAATRAARSTGRCTGSR